jgi:PAS domain S-box-containing protein
MGTILDAGLLFQLSPHAALTRCGLYVCLIFFLFIESILIEKAWDGHLKFDIISTLLFGYMVWQFLRLSHRSKERKLHYEREVLEALKQIDQKNMELAESERLARRLALVAENANDSVIISDPKGMIEWVNPGFTDDTGYSAEEVIGQGTWILNGPETDQTTIAAIVSATEQGKPIRTEIQNKVKDGTYRWTELSLTPVKDQTGAVECFVSVERNISLSKTREHALDEARVQAEALAQTKSRFLANMSHEIRTPMNGVLGTADLLLQTPLQDDQRMLVQTLIESGDALLSIINDILDFSKLEAGRFEIAQSDFALDDCLSGVVDLMIPLAEAKGIGLNLRAAALPKTLLVGDSARLRQILLNLVGNAIKFTQDGQVTISVTATCAEGRCDLVVSVADTGIGISPDRLEYIFDLFSQADGSVTRRFGGTGLGLSISRTLARAMGGDIEVTSEIGEGSDFRLHLTLPCSTTMAKSGEHPTETASLQLDGLRLLVAEDNRTNRFLIQKMLDGSGVDLIFAEDGQKAVEMYQRHRPDVVLMDISMPFMNGLEATGAILARDKELGLTSCPILALTANAFEEDRRICMEAGMSGFLTKPFKRRELFQALGEILEEGSLSS